MPISFLLDDLSNRLERLTSQRDLWTVHTADSLRGEKLIRDYHILAKTLSDKLASQLSQYDLSAMMAGNVLVLLASSNLGRYFLNSKFKIFAT